MQFDIITVLWGHQFVDVFTSFCLPSLMAKGNLPNWPYPTRYVLFTTAEDALRIKQTQVFQFASQIIEFDFQLIQHPGRLSQMKYFLQTAFHARAVERAIHEGRGVILLTPDGFLCNGSLDKAQTELRAGKEVLMTVGPRIDLEQCFDYLLAKQDSQTCSLALSSSECITLFKNHLHPLSQISFIDHDLFVRLPSHVYQKSETGFCLQAFHMHPFLFKQPLSMEHSFTCESDYMQKYDHMRDKIAVLNNHEFIMFGIEWGEYELDAIPLPLELRWPYIQQYAQQHCSPIHQWFFSQPIYWPI